MIKNLILNTDSYKTSMFVQYPPGTTEVYSYIESRGPIDDKTVYFGLQAFIKEYMLTPITMADVIEAEEIITAHGEPFNKDGWIHILNVHNGFLPVEIKSLPEGTVVDTKNVLLTIRNTDSKCFWLTTYLETALLRAIWYPTTVATNSFKIKQLILNHLKKTGNPESIDFKLHDFGARGVSSNESAMIGGMAHLINFMGTDTVVALYGAKKYYNERIAGFSIPAAEHSTITSWGKQNESVAYDNMLNQFAKPGTMVAVVSDSYNIYNAVDNIWGKELKQKVIDSGATLIVRPDSGIPKDVVLDVVKSLDKSFGSIINDKGYKVLNNVRVIQGDGIDYNTIEEILDNIENEGYSADNVAFGMGGMLLQAPMRDDFKFAMKASNIVINGFNQDVFKDPITDPNKTSKKGKFAVVYEGGYGTGLRHRTVSPDYIDDFFAIDCLKTVFKDGYLLVDEDFSTIRARAKEGLY